MTPEQLHNIGKALYGERSFVDRFANALEVNPRTVQRWLSGQNDMPEWLPERCAGVIADHIRELERLMSHCV
tara:strand:+ start:90 stop:305 length:216 start_codon:yes stop_codon:yes gene_type:complete